jgi:DUF1680 family protein
MPITWNRPPLAPNRFALLPLGSVRARGWIAEQLRRAATGLTGRLMDVWPDVGAHSAWLGGHGESWERGPYYARGLVSLAHALDDADLKLRAQRWIDGALASQSDDGFFGPRHNPDWWARMPMLEALRLQHEATGDRRILPFLTRYFHHQRITLPQRPLELWAKPRGGDNLDSVLWLYNRTGDSSLLELADLLHQQTSDWIGELSADGAPNEEFDFGHGVNRAMGLKEPAVYAQRSGDPAHLAAIRKGWNRLVAHHGQIHGGYSCDEFFHGRGSTQGCELCTVVEVMSSFETILKISGEPWLADAIERLAYNALPAMLTADLCARQYFQLPNQIECTPGNRNFWVGHGTDLLFGLETGFGCCTANLHIGWPHLTHHLWLATPAGGLAALLLGPSEVTATVAGGQTVRVVEETEYPFDGDLAFTIGTTAPVRFPLCVRLPGWARGVEAAINGEPCPVPQADEGESVLLVCEREWRDADVLSVRLPMPVRCSTWDGPSVGVERGPLVYAHAIAEDWRQVDGTAPFCDYEVRPASAWNYGLRAIGATVERRSAAAQPWTLQDAPVRLRIKASRIPAWIAVDDVSGPIPRSSDMAESGGVDLQLVPYGCARLRISMFPDLR